MATNLSTADKLLFKQFMRVKRRLDKRRAERDDNVEEQQQDEQVPEYTQRFYDVTREAKDMSVCDQISWYIKGLVPALRGRCATDDEGKDW